MESLEKDLRVLGDYITELIKNDPSTGGNFNRAASEAGISPAELFSLRKGIRQKPNPGILRKIAERFHGNYPQMLCLAGIISPPPRIENGKPCTQKQLSFAEEQMLVLARHIEDISPAEMEELKGKLADTIDMYLYKKRQLKE